MGRCAGREHAGRRRRRPRRPPVSRTVGERSVVALSMPFQSQSSGARRSPGTGSVECIAGTELSRTQSTSPTGPGLVGPRWSRRRSAHQQRRDANEAAEGLRALRDHVACHRPVVRGREAAALALHGAVREDPRVPMPGRRREQIDQVFGVYEVNRVPPFTIAINERVCADLGPPTRQLIRAQRMPSVTK